MRTEANADDAADLAATAQGDRAAFERLFRRHQPRLRAFLLRHCARSDLVDDAVNKALWAVWTHAGRFRGESAVATWITGIAYRSLLKLLRDTGVPQERGEASFNEAESQQWSGAQDESVHAQGEQRELRDWLAKGLILLPADQRQALELAYFGGLSCEEIAQQQGCAEGTVKARLFHARMRLRSLMPGLAGKATETKKP